MSLIQLPPGVSVEMTDLGFNVVLADGTTVTTVGNHQPTQADIQDAINGRSQRGFWRWLHDLWLWENMKGVP